MPLPGREQESTTCVTADGAIRRFSTTDPVDMRYMIRKGLQPASVGKIDGEEISWEFVIPEDWNTLPRPKKKMGADFGAKMSERLRNNGEDE